MLVLRSDSSFAVPILSGRGTELLRRVVRVLFRIALMASNSDFGELSRVVIERKY